MKLFELKQSLAGLVETLTSEDSEILQLADECNNEEAFRVAAMSLILAADLIKQAEIAVDEIALNKQIDANDLDAIAALAEELSASDDETLQKSASVLDTLLMTLASPKDGHTTFKKNYELEISRIKAARKDSDNYNLNSKIKGKFEDKMKKAVKEQIKEYRPLEASLMTRFCPDHPGVMMNRVEDRVFQCSLDQKTYDFENGYTTLKGNKVPGSSVNNNHFDNNQQVSFSTREDLMKR